MELKQKGYTLRRISRVLSMSRKTVRRYVYADACPTRARRSRCSATDTFVDYLHRRWEEGCHSARRLTDELRQQGFHGSYEMVSRCVHPWRTRVLPSPALRDPIVRRHSPNQVAWLLLMALNEQRETERAFLEKLWQVSPSLAEASQLAQQFHELVRRRDTAALTSWIEDARKSVLKSFGDSIASDVTAVSAALSQPWSNGQVEGQVNRLKTIKRQMFGRASFDLLRLRVLAAA